MSKKRYVADLTAEERDHLKDLTNKGKAAARVDCEYRRNGTANPFMLFAPLEGWRHVKVTERRAAIDCAHVPKDLADTHFPKAEKITLVQDNLNTHVKASLYTKGHYQ